MKEKETIHLLLIDDEPEFLNELVDTMREDHGYHNVEKASNVAEAKEKLKAPFDVIIADMRMDTDDSGFEIIEEVKILNLSSVVIILTANDTIEDCRKAFKMGAWDYISKSTRVGGKPFDELLDQSIQEAIAYFNSWGNIHNERWIEENRESLEKQYFGQYIAVINKTVIDAADTQEALEKRIEERQIRRFLTTIRQIGEFCPISELVKLGESDKLERKASLEWNFEENKKSPETKFKALKDIVAFLNTEGGYLLIGIEDKTGNIVGLANDLSLLDKNSLDEFEQKLTHLIRSYIGVEFHRYIKIYFDKVDNKDVCAVRVLKSDQPAFFKQNRDEPKYIIRTNNISRPLNPEEMYKHLKGRKLI